MMTLIAFRARYPEFRTASDELVQAILDDAALRVDPRAFGKKIDIAHGLVAAHLLLNSPYGRSQRLESGEAEDDRHMQEYALLHRECIPTIFVI